MKELHHCQLKNLLTWKGSQQSEDQRVENISSTKRFFGSAEVLSNSREIIVLLSVIKMDPITY